MPATRAQLGRRWLALGCALTLVGGCGTDSNPSSAPPAASSGAGSPASTGVASSTLASVPPTAAPTSPPSDGFAILPGTQPEAFAGDLSCSGTIDAADPVAIVRLAGTGNELGPRVLQDYADPDAPRAVCAFGTSGWNGARFVDARHIVIGPFDAPGLYVIVDVPEIRFHWIQLPAGSDSSFSSQLAAVSPALDRVIWVSHETGNGGFDAVHVTTAAGDQSIAKLRDTNEGRCGDEDDSSLGAFTPSGSLAYVLNRPLPADASLLVVDGADIRYSVLAPKGGWSDREGPAKAIWSTTLETLYYQMGDGIWRWSAATGAERFLGGVRWFGPSISPDGTYLAYSARDADGLPDVYLVDLANTGDPERLGTGHHNFPAFLDNEHLWYQATISTPGCEGGEPVTPLVYNLVDGIESPTTIEGIIATWPAQ